MNRRNRRAEKARQRKAPQSPAEQRVAAVIGTLAPVLRARGQGQGHDVLLSSYVTTSELYRRATYAHTQDDLSALQLLIEDIRLGAVQNPSSPEHLFMTAWCQTMEGGLCLLAMARWADQGFPVVRLSDRLAASMMATTCTMDDGSLMPPWKAFLILPPQGILRFDGKNGPETVKHIWVIATTAAHCVDRPESRFAWFIAAIGDQGTMLHFVRTERELFAEANGNVPGFDHALRIDMTATDDRVAELVQRLVGGVCLEMSDPSALDAAKRGKSHARASSREGGPAEPRIYELTRAVTLDVRGEIKAYVEGRRGTRPSVQVLVAGHWKRQRCGTGGVERKIIHVEPYWRGPELAPILAKTKERL